MDEALTAVTEPILNIGLFGALVHARVDAVGLDLCAGLDFFAVCLQKTSSKSHSEQLLQSRVRELEIVHLLVDAVVLSESLKRIHSDRVRQHQLQRNVNRPDRHQNVDNGDQSDDQVSSIWDDSLNLGGLYILSFRK